MKIKQYLLAAAALVTALSSVKAQELTYDWGVADTVAHHSVGPGMTYAKVIYPKSPSYFGMSKLTLQTHTQKSNRCKAVTLFPTLSGGTL